MVPLRNKVACSRYVQIHNHPSLPNGNETAPTCICPSEVHPGCLKTKEYCGLFNVGLEESNCESIAISIFDHT